MPRVVWTEQMAVGVPFVDADHKVLIELINQVSGCLDDSEEFATLGTVLRALAYYTEYHFQREEELLGECGYPGRDHHVAQHRRLTAQVIEIGQRYEADPTSVRGAEVLEFLYSWLTNHILKHDLDYSPFVLGQAPAVEATAESGTGTGTDDVPRRPRTFAEMRVLVVDDNTNFRTLLHTLLGGVGVGDVALAADGSAGLAAIMAPPGFDAVICDWYMDGVNGHSFLERLRALPDPRLAKVGVIVLTGRADAAVRTKAFAAGANAFLEKPASAKDILTALADVINAE